MKNKLTVMVLVLGTLMSAGCLEDGGASGGLGRPDYQQWDRTWCELVGDFRDECRKGWCPVVVNCRETPRDIQLVAFYPEERQLSTSYSSSGGRLRVHVTLVLVNRSASTKGWVALPTLKED